jgi:Ala-tRNA(Pro) deacylase
MRVPQFLSDRHIPFETVIHPPAFTAQKRARFLRVPGKQVAKCVLLAGPDSYLLAVLPATHYIDLEAVARVAGVEVRLAEDGEIAEVFRDCEWGVTAPFGTLYGLQTLLDDSLDPDALMVFEAHSHALAIRMRCRDFEQLEKPRRFRFALTHPQQRSAAPPAAKLHANGAM